MFDRAYSDWFVESEVEVRHVVKRKRAWQPQLPCQREGTPRLQLPSASPVSAAVPARGKEGEDSESFFGTGAHESGYPNPDSAIERVLGSKKETVQQNSKRQGDLGINGVLGAGSVALIDLTVSDGGGSKPGPDYVPGAHRQRNATAKRANYVGDNARFTGIQRSSSSFPAGMPWGERRRRRMSSCRL